MSAGIGRRKFHEGLLHDFMFATLRRQPARASEHEPSSAIYSTIDLAGLQAGMQNRPFPLSSDMTASRIQLHRELTLELQQMD
jgi:hypothetical protein